MNNEDDVTLPDDTFEPRRERVDIQIDAFVRHGNHVYRITQILDFDSVIATEVESGRSTPLRVAELRPLGPDEVMEFVDISEIADEDWKVAEFRFAAIQPLLKDTFLGRQDVERRAQEINIDPSTLYRWLRRYRAHETVSALVPKKRGWRTGKGRISAEIEGVIKEVIKQSYLTLQRRSVQKVVKEIIDLCGHRGYPVPSPGTVRARIGNISERDRLRGRGHKEKAKNKFLPAAGKFPHATFPLAAVQIDHTPADIIIVDDVYRRPIGKPWITLAIDVYSRMVLGFYVSLDPPSETSVAICVARSILPKEEWLLLNKIDASWPVWGFPKMIHVDNGPEFRSNTFRKSCLQYGIQLEFRPVKQPNYGGHIERMLGTLAQEIHDLPGTTFSNVKERDNYDSEKHAIFTLDELDNWLTSLICKVYHQRLHSELGMSPLRQWEIGIFGNQEVDGVGVPARPSDRFSVLLDFLPAFQRTVQPIGVTIDGLNYYSDALRSWINAEDPENKGKKRDFTFRRDPRNISALWFFDPELKQYFKIPYADQSLPTMSLWEYRAAREKLKREGVEAIDERQISRAISELRAKVDEAQEKTKKARRQAQRRREHEKATTVPVLPKPPVEKSPQSFDQSLGLLDGDIDLFGDIA